MTGLDDIRARAAVATKGPWHWSGNTDSRSIALCHWGDIGRETIMDFTRWGMQFAVPRFRVPGDIFMQPAHERVVYEVAPDATRRQDPRVYRADIVGIRHADAVFLAAARQDVDDLLAVIDAVGNACSDLAATAARDTDVRFGAGAVTTAVREILDGAR